jgi:hypothetical protein
MLTNNPQHAVQFDFLISEDLWGAALESLFQNYWYYCCVSLEPNPWHTNGLNPSTV